MCRNWGVQSGARCCAACGPCLRGARDVVGGSHGDCRRVGVEGLRSRASAARSGEATRSLRVGLVASDRKWSRQASARRETLQRWPPESGTRQSAEKRESAGKQGLESVQNTAKSGQAWCQREQDCRGEQRRTSLHVNDTNIWVSPTALGVATPMDSATADAPVEAQIGTIEDGGQLLQAQVSSFRQKQKIRKMAEYPPLAAPKVAEGGCQKC
ncbi:hypothetical protein EDB86DRAFT_3246591 [Lactarius hatsudake]|nr:hypothetical protein EDB86DRAFT_3246591 [Lactarius hatsudake]